MRTVSPVGSRMAAAVPTSAPGPAYAADSDSVRAHLRGCLALTTAPSLGSTSANARSPSNPRAVQLARATDSPSSDFTG